jgi:hypothetical protein
MKKFLTLILYVFIFVAFVQMVIFKIDPFAISSIGKKIDILRRENKKLEIVNFGTSHGYVFKYNFCNLKGIGLNKPANTIYYDLQNYKYIVQNNILKDSAVIVFPISYFSFVVNENRSDLKNSSNFNNDYYFYLDNNQIWDFSYSRKFLCSLLVIQENFRSLTIGESKKKWFEIDNNKASLEWHSKVTGNKFIQYLENTEKTELEEIKSRNFQYLIDIVELAKKKNHRIIFVTVPYYGQLLENIGYENLEKNYYLFINKILVKYDDIKYYNYSNFFDGSELTVWQNSDHVSDEGADIFSKFFFNQLNMNTK